MKTNILLAILCISIVNLHAQRIKGSGPMTTRTFDLASFHTFESSVSADIEVTQGATQKVTIEGQANIIDLISQEVKEHKWRIKLPKGSYSDYEELKIKITVPELKGIGLAGSGSILTTNTIKTDDFQIGLSGSGKINAAVDAEYVDCGLSGSGNVMIKGKAKELNIGTSGSGDIKASDLEVKSAKIGMSGSGDITINASESLEAGIAGSGSVRYKGRPKVKSSISGSGSVSSMD